MDQNLDESTEIESKLDMYNDIHAFINIHTQEIGSLSRLKTTISDETVISDVDRRLSELHQKINELLDTRRAVESWLPHLPKVQRAVIKRRCMEGRSWENVAIMLQLDGINLGIRQAQKHKNQAIETILKIVKENEHEKH